MANLKFFWNGIKDNKAKDANEKLEAWNARIDSLIAMSAGAQKQIGQEVSS